MAADFNKPVVGDNYIAVLQFVRDNISALAVMLDPGSSLSAGATNIPTGTIRWNSTSSPARFETWDGSAWDELTQAYLPLAGGSLTGLVEAGSGIDVTGGSIRMRSQLPIRFDAEDDSHKWSILQSGAASNNNLVIYDQARSVTVMSFDAANGNVLIPAGLTVSGNATAVSVYASSWFRSTGATGWFAQDYNGGIYMTDTQYVRTYNNKGLQASIGSNSFFALALEANANRAFGKLAQLLTTAGTGGDGPQIHFAHAGICEWGFGIEDSNGSGLAMYYGGSASSFGSKKFVFQSDGRLLMSAASPAILLNHTGTGITRFVYNDGSAVGFLNSSSGWAARSDNNGDFVVTGNMYAQGNSAQIGHGQYGEKRLAFLNSVRAVEVYLNNSSTFGVNDVSGGFDRLSSDSSGNLNIYNTAYAVAFVPTSDASLKKNKRRIAPSAETIFGLARAAHYFDWKRSGQADAGFLAQMVGAVEPLALHKRDDGYYGLNMTPILAHLAVHAADVERRLQALEMAA